MAGIAADKEDCLVNSGDAVTLPCMCLRGLSGKRYKCHDQGEKEEH